MKNENLIHEWMISHLQEKLSRSYDDVKSNPAGDKKNEYKGAYPDLILSNHGLVMALMEVETAGSITREKTEEWKSLSQLGAKLILMVPKSSKAKIIDLLWKSGLADKAAIGSYEISVTMP